MEDNLNNLANGRRPQYFGKWKKTSIFWQMEDDLNILANGRQPHISKNQVDIDFILNFLLCKAGLASPS